MFFQIYNFIFYTAKPLPIRCKKLSHFTPSSRQVSLYRPAPQVPVQKMHHLCTILPDKSLPVQKMPHLCTGLPGRRLLVQKNTLSCTNLSGKRNPVPNASIFDTGSNSLPKRQLSTTESPHYVWGNSFSCRHFSAPWKQVSHPAHQPECCRLQPHCHWWFR